jgi:hypothetical protein
MADWAWDVDVPTTQERALLVCLEDHGADEDWIGMRLIRLQFLTKMSEGRLKKAANALWEMGILEFETSVAGRPSRWRVKRPLAAHLSSIPSPPQTPPFPGSFTFGKTRSVGARTHEEEPAESTKHPHHDTAHSLTKEWFSQEPRPMLKGGFPAAMQLLKQTLAAGWTEEQISDMLRTGPIPTIGGLEYGLRKMLPKQEPTPQAIPAKHRKLFCEDCGASGNIRSPQGLRCVRCGSLWEV